MTASAHKMLGNMPHVRIAAGHGAMKLDQVQLAPSLQVQNRESHVVRASGGVWIGDKHKIAFMCITCAGPAVQAASGTDTQRSTCRSVRVRCGAAAGVGLQVLQQLAGINTVMYFTPAILELAGIHNNRLALLVRQAVFIAEPQSPWQKVLPPVRTLGRTPSTLLLEPGKPGIGFFLQAASLLAVAEHVREASEDMTNGRTLAVEVLP